MAAFEALLHRDHLGVVTYALEQFQVSDRRDREVRELIEPLRGLGQAAQVPDQHIGVDQHR